eukprot:scaffold7.g3643.t1
MAEEFVVPAEPAELWQDSELAFRAEGFVDLSQSAPEEVGEIAENVAFVLCDQDPLCVVEQQNFDSLCSLLAAFHLVEGPKRRQLVDSLCSSLTCLNAWIDKLLAQPPDAVEPEAVRQHRSAFKAYLFFLSWVSGLASRESRDAAPAPAPAASAAGGGRGRKKKGGAEVAVGWDWGAQQAKVVKAVAQAMNTDLWALFRPGWPEEGLMVRITQLAVGALEAPASAKDAELVGQAAHVLAVAALKYGQLEPVASALVDLVSKHEHTPIPVAAVLRYSIAQYDDGRLAATVVGELAAVDPAEYERQQGASGEKAGVRSVAALVEELAERLPRFMAGQIALLLPHLGGKAYSLRQGIVHAIGHLVHLAYGDAVADAADAQGAAARLRSKQHLLDVLYRRIWDQSSYVRMAVLKTWAHLAEKKAVPLGHWQVVTRMAVGRLEDKSSLVRKEALRLIQVLMMNNPFGPSLPKERFEASLLHHKAMLEQLLPPSQEGDGIEAALPSIERPGQQEGEGGDAEAVAAEAEAGAVGDAAVKGEPGAEAAEGMEVDGEPAPAAEQPQEQEQAAALARQPMRSPAEVGWDSTVEELQALVASLGLAVEFAQTLSGCMDQLSNLLASSTVSDVQESIALLLACKQFEVHGAGATIRKMLPLIFSHDQAIKDRIVEALLELYVNGWAGSMFSAAQAARNLLDLASGATLGELGALEEVLKQFAARGCLRPTIVRELWDVAGKAYAAVATGAAGADKAHADLRAALALLSMAAASQPQLFQEQHMRAALKFGFSARAPDALLTRHACVLLQRLGDSFATGAYDDVLNGVYAALIRTVIASPLPDSCWYSAAEAALTALYHLHPTPEHLAAAILRRLAARAFAAGGPAASAAAGAPGAEAMEGVEGEAQGEARVEDRPALPQGEEKSVPSRPLHSVSALGRFFFALGHVALQHLVYIERVSKLLRRRRMDAEKRAADEAAERARGGGSQGGKEDEDINAELGVGSVAADAELDALKEESEAQVLGPRSLLRPYAQLVAALCRSRALLAADPGLRGAALLALAKLMVVDARFCDDNLRLLFSLLKADRGGEGGGGGQTSPWLEAPVRSNLAISLGDLALRHPNALEPWTEHVYRPLDDGDAGVRKNALMVLTHLILNDMMKVKGHIARMAVRLEDPDPRIAALAKLFFSELAKKEYKDLLGYIKKDKQGDALVEKLCQRFAATQDVGQWHNIAFCLTQLPTSDKGLRKLCESFKLYKHALGDEEVATAITGIVAKAKKGAAKAEMKALIEEFEAKIVAYAEERAEEERTAEAARRHAEEQRTAAEGRAAATAPRPGASELAEAMGGLGLEDGAASGDQQQQEHRQAEQDGQAEQEEGAAVAAADAETEEMEEERGEEMQAAAPAVAQPAASGQSGAAIKPDPEAPEAEAEAPAEQEPPRRRGGRGSKAAAAGAAAIPARPSRAGGRCAAASRVAEESEEEEEQGAAVEEEEEAPVPAPRDGRGGARGRVAKLAAQFEGGASAAPALAAKRGAGRRRAVVADSEGDSEGEGGGSRISAMRAGLANVKVERE